MKKSVTLIELMVVIIVIGILSAIAIPNIKNAKIQASLNGALENKINVQKGVDRYMLEKQEFPCVAQPTVGHPQSIDWTKLEPPYLMQKPQDLDKFYYWIDSFGSIWMSDIDSPTGLNITGTTVTFNDNPEAITYQVGYIENVAYRVVNEINAGSRGYNWSKRGQNGDGNFALTNGKVTVDIPDDLTGKTLVVNVISKNGLATAPVSIGYAGNQLEVPIGEKPVAVITMTPNSDIDTDTNITWSSSTSTDPKGRSIVQEEWDNKQATYSIGSQTVKLRVKNSLGYWSEWSSVTFNVSTADDLAKLNLGEYIKYGNFNGRDLTWQVIKKADGDAMLLMTDGVKNADGSYYTRNYDVAPSGGEPTDGQRSAWGSNNYEYSDLRIWLNGTFYNTAFANKSIIKDTSHEYVLANIDSAQATIGTTKHVASLSTTALNTSLQNYNTTAYRKSVTDKVYSVSIKELVEDIYPVIGNGYYNAAYGYWLRDSYADYSYAIRVVGGDASIGWNDGYMTFCTVRPALNLQSASFSSGTGTQADPYVVD